MGRREEIAELNSNLFGKKDYYSTPSNLKDTGVKFIVTLKDKKVVGYVIYTEFEDSLSGERSGVHPDYRGLGVGKKLFMRMKKMAQKRGKKYKTYVRFSNYPSIVIHIRIGMRIYHHDETWVYLTT